MRFRALLPLSLVVSALLSGNASAQSTQRPEVAAAAEAMKQKVVAWRRDFHEHPELSLHEARTASKVAEHLRALGLKPVTLGGHGVMAVIQGGKPGPKIALRADMDALPVTEKTGLPFASKATTTFRARLSASCMPAATMRTPAS
jgi:amidohydrolase